MWAEECEPGGGVVMGGVRGSMGGEGVEAYSGGSGVFAGEREGGGGGGVWWGVRVVVEQGRGVWVWKGEVRGRWGGHPWGGKEDPTIHPGEDSALRSTSDERYIFLHMAFHRG